MKHVSYLSFYVSPIGIIRINTGDYDVISITFVDDIDDGIENDLSIRIKNELDAYFKGELKSFSFYNYLVAGLERKVMEIVCHIPYGEFMTYRDVARELGDENVISPVRKTLDNSSFPILLPSHRVIDSKENIGDYVGGVERKRFLLELENIICK